MMGAVVKTSSLRLWKTLGIGVTSRESQSFPFSSTTRFMVGNNFLISLELTDDDQSLLPQLTFDI